MDRVAFSILGVNVYWYGITASLGVFLGVTVAYLLAKNRNRFLPDEIINVVLIALPFGMIGARLYYVLFRWDYYSQHLGEIIVIRSGGLAFHGGLIIGIIAGIIYCRLRKIPLGHLLDCCGPALLLGQGIGRWGNFFNQEAHGGVVSETFIRNFPDFIQKGMLIEGEYYHPAFLYEFLWNILVFVIIMLLWNKYKELPGTMFSLYLIGYSLGRFWIEGLRTDSLMLGPLRIAQVVSIIGILAGLLFLFLSGKKE